jgi:hypothetical protein
MGGHAELKPANPWEPQVQFEGAVSDVRRALPAPSVTVGRPWGELAISLPQCPPFYRPTPRIKGPLRDSASPALIGSSLAGAVGLPVLT